MVKAANASEEIHKCEWLRTHRASLTTRSDGTSGSQKSDEAVIGNLDAMTRAETSGDSLDHERTAKNGRLSVDVLGLSVRPSTCLQKVGVKTIADLLAYKPHDLMDLQNFGVTSLVEIEEALEEQGLALATSANQKQRQSAAAQPIAPGGTSEVDESILAVPIDVLLLHIRSFNVLRRVGIDTVGVLVTKTETELLALYNFGDTSLNDVKMRLAVHGLSLGSIHPLISKSVGLNEVAAQMFESISRQSWLTPSVKDALLDLGIATLDDLEALDLITLSAVPEVGIDKARAIQQNLANMGRQLSESAGDSPTQLLEPDLYDQIVVLLGDLNTNQIAARLETTEAKVEFAKRKWILDSVADGQSHRAVGDVLGITAEAARRQHKRVAVHSTSETRRGRREARESQQAELTASIEDDAVTHPGTTIEQIAQRLSIDIDTVESHLTPKARNRVLTDTANGPSPDSQQRWSDEQLVEVLRTAATYEFPLTTNSYNRLREVGEIDGPTVVIFHSRFGSWNAACDAAGVEHGQTFIETYNSQWTDDDMRRYVSEYFCDPETRGTADDFKMWLENRSGSPSFILLRQRLGRWLEIRLQALTVLKEQWAPDDNKSQPSEATRE